MPDDVVDSELPDPIELRRRLVEIDDERRTLPADAFARRYELGSEADALRRVLRSILQNDLDAANELWQERVGRKGSHTVDIDLARARASIVSPIHMN